MRRSPLREQIVDFLTRHWTEQPPPPILLRGEVGVGKSLLARLIHRAGPRRHGPFVVFDCAAIPEALLEAELVGNAPGAFCEARPGLVQGANGGTLFLDHVTLLPEELLKVLISMLEKRWVRRVGSTLHEAVDVWIIAGTYGDLRAKVDDRRRYREAFNLHERFVEENLYQHLAPADVLIPPLRQRPEDILLLAEDFLAHTCAEHHLPPKSFAADARGAMLAYPWPGNFRELRAMIERVALHSAKKDVITAAMLALPESSEPAGRTR